MKRLLLILVCLAAAVSSWAATTNVITATIVITNTIGVTNGATITVNSDTRTWTNNVVLPVSQILTNSYAGHPIGGAASNLFNHVANSAFVGVTLQRSGTNGIALRGAVNGNMVVSVSAGYASITLTTNTLSPVVTVRVPYTAESAQQQTNIASGIVAMLSASPNTNAVAQSSTAFTNSLVGTTNTQLITGIKVNTGSNWFSSFFAANPQTTNLVNRGNAIVSRGTGSLSEQFGAGANAAGGSSTALGGDAVASGPFSTALGNSAVASSDSSIAIGYASSAIDTNSISIGNGSGATKSNSIAIGVGAAATHTNSTAIGYAAATSRNNQTVLGSGGVEVLIGGGLTVAGSITNIHAAGTNIFPAGSDVSFGRYANSSLANGNNAAVLVGTNIFIQVSGPSGAFTINGIAGGRDGKWLILLNRTGQNMTIANDSGVDPSAANRIYTLTGGDVSTTGDGCATLIYNATDSRWILTAIQQ